MKTLTIVSDSVGIERIKEAFAKDIKDMKIAVVTKVERTDPFGPEPILITREREDDLKEPQYFEIEPSKFINKPRHNFKKR
jgi:hypothetical protein